MRHGIPTLRGTKLLMKAALMLLLAGLWAVPAQGQFILAEDEASNYDNDNGDTWNDESNEGFGFGAWDFEDEGENSGHFIGDSEALDDGNGGDVNTDGVSFVMFGYSGELSQAFRDLPRALDDGDVLTLEVAVNFLGGAKGFNFRDSDGVFIDNFIAENDEYRLFDDELFDSELDANTVFTFTFTQNEDELEWQVDRTGGRTEDASGTNSDINAGDIAEIEFFVDDAGNDAGDNLHFNSLKIETDDENNLENVTARLGEDFTLENDLTTGGFDIPDGRSLNIDSHTLTVTTDGIIDNRGTFNAGTGKVAFNGDNTVSGSVAFNNVDLSGGVDFGSDSELEGEMRILAGGFVNTNPPDYQQGSTLTYNNESDFGVGDEWPEEDNNPYNVRTVDTEVNIDGDRNIGNDLIVEEDGSIIQDDAEINVGSNLNIEGVYIQDDAEINVGSNLNIEGVYEVSGNEELIVSGNLGIGSDGSLSLGDFGADLRLEGDWTKAGSFSANDRAVFFNGTEPQEIENTTADPIEIPFLFIQNDVEAQTDLVVENQLDVGLEDEGNEGKTLTMLSDNSLITPDDLNYINEGVIEFQRELEGGSGWRMFGFPVDGVSVEHLAGQNQVQGINGANGFYDEFSDIEFEDGQAPNLHTFDPEEFDSGAEGPTGWLTPDNFESEFNSGNGLIWYFFDNNIGPSVALDDFTLSIIGEQPAGDQNISIDDGEWNLVGNPFGANLHAEQLSGDGLQSAAAQVYDPDDGSYEVVNFEEGETISAFQGFFIESDDAENFEIPATSRVVDDAEFYRRESKEKHQLAFTLTGEREDGYTTNDRAIQLYLNQEATHEWDSRDVRKMVPPDNDFAVMAFAGERDGDTMLKAQESRPVELEEEIEIPMELILNNMSGDFQLNWEGVSSLPEDMEISVTNEHTGETVKLHEAESMNFSADEDHGEGFTLTLSPGDVTSTEPEREMPEELTLEQNYPNPFNPVTTISYALPEDAQVELSVYDAMGRRITTLVDDRVNAGQHEVSWDASNVASGTYLYRLEVDGQIKTNTMTLVK